MQARLAPFLVAVLAASLPAFSQAQPARATLHLVLVLDGLRPDAINAQDTPNLHRLRTEGVTFANSHSVFPTVTRVNAAAIATGTYPARNGLLGNNVFIPAVDAKRSFNTDDGSLLMRLGDRILTAPSMAEIVHQAGEKFVAVSSGSTGGTLLLAPRAPSGAGTLINGYFPGRISYPKEPGDDILKRLGAAPKKGAASDPFDEPVAWAMGVLREYVLPEMKPRVVISWLTEPDHSQHAFGPGSPEATASLRKDDAEIGSVLRKLEALGLKDRTNIFVVSDHGFSQTSYIVNVAQELTNTGLMRRDDDDVVIASSGQAVALHVRDRDPARIAKIVEFLQRQSWCGVVFTSAGRQGAHEGAVPGTFALELAHLGGHERSPDIVFTFPWSSERNRHGMPGSDYSLTTGKTGPPGATAANHGGIGPWTVRNTMLAWGADFKRGAIVRTPAANVDVAPTILHLLGLRQAVAAMDGRPLLEALVDGPDEEQVSMETRTLSTASGAYRAALQATEVAGKRYVDKAWRLP